MRTNEDLELVMTETRSPDWSLRLLGILPLLFFLAQAVHYWRIDEMGNMLWMCNIGNLLLAVGMFLEHRRLIRLAAIWMFPGLLVWLVYVVLAWGVFLTSTLAHVGGLVLGILALRKVGMDRRSWLYALGWYLLVQFLSRVASSPSLNVNLAHKIQPGWEQWFGAYWQFWLTLTLVTAVILWTVGVALQRIWPEKTA
ncbi:MAG TPA: hypothetical protein VKB46_25370 [Pyrinomonadaceae bacterium]|nr:hypothetical protein [Pyrinomonadaceae bacterium]